MAVLVSCLFHIATVALTDMLGKYMPWLYPALFLPFNVGEGTRSKARIGIFIYSWHNRRYTCKKCTKL